MDSQKEVETRHEVEGKKPGSHFNSNQPIKEVGSSYFFKLPDWFLLDHVPKLSGVPSTSGSQTFVM
jgi:hypothetical protein